MEVSKILDMLDWHMPQETQAKGIALAVEFGVIEPFLQPLTQKHNKNVWDNCATIIAYKSDQELEAHLISLVEWLQDMNWPGAFIILERLKEYSDNNTLHAAADACIQEARRCDDPIWEDNIQMIFANKNI